MHNAGSASRSIAYCTVCHSGLLEIRTSKTIFCAGGSMVLPALGLKIA
jgi:hypothetical protein